MGVKRASEASQASQQAVLFPLLFDRNQLNIVPLIKALPQLLGVSAEIKVRMISLIMMIV